MQTETVDYYVMKTLDSLEGWTYPSLPLKHDNKNLFLGSGNASNVAGIFAKKFGGNAVSVANYKEYLSARHTSDFASINIINASGGKDGINMASFLKENGFNFSLFTCNPQPPAGEFTPKENVFVFPSFVEPPTYNVSTYASMIYAIMKENVGDIKENIKNMEIPDLRKHKFIFFVAEDKYELPAVMSARKVGESLAGLGSAGEGIATAVHGMLVHENNDRLDFCMNCDTGTKNTYKLEIDSYLGLIMSAYYIIGKNQTASDMESIMKNYTSTAQKLGWKFNKVW
ncbi:MAG: hypothetical protein HY051_06350 [Candidatus Aenigmarchaeota archaeon]|nr:hypothetical protein [Candidatus Aenigmarchaeota archaeon]